MVSLRVWVHPTATVWGNLRVWFKVCLHETRFFVVWPKIWSSHTNWKASICVARHKFGRTTQIWSHDTKFMFRVNTPSAMETWLLGPPLLVGERIVFRNHGNYLPGTIRWLGRLRDCFGNQMVAGLVLVSAVLSSMHALMCRNRFSL
jgi:hypothetical protein